MIKVRRRTRLRESGGKSSSGPGRGRHPVGGPTTLVGPGSTQRVHQGARHQGRIDLHHDADSEGINVNVTLLFGLPRYREVAEAYLAGLEKRAENGKPLSRVASVASFFLSRIDVLVDPLLEKVMKEGGRKGETAEKIHGQVAVSSAKVAYEMYKEMFGGERFDEIIRERAQDLSAFCGPVPARKIRNIPIPNT